MGESPPAAFSVEDALLTQERKNHVPEQKKILKDVRGAKHFICAVRKKEYLIVMNVMIFPVGDSGLLQNDG
jgi:hypothetical protein